MLVRWITLIFERWWILLHNDRKSWHWRIKASLVAQLVKNLPATQKLQVWSLGREESLEKEMATNQISLFCFRVESTLLHTIDGSLQSWLLKNTHRTPNDNVYKNLQENDAVYNMKDMHQQSKAISQEWVWKSQKESPIVPLSVKVIVKFNSSIGWGTTVVGTEYLRTKEPQRAPCLVM